MHNVLALPGRAGGASSAFIATAFEAARSQWRRLSGLLRPKLPKPAAYEA
jgi:hypothetical protein